jgi:hypothetical protein
VVISKAAKNKINLRFFRIIIIVRKLDLIIDLIFLQYSGFFRAFFYPGKS